MTGNRNHNPQPTDQDIRRALFWAMLTGLSGPLNTPKPDDLKDIESPFEIPTDRGLYTVKITIQPTARTPRARK